MPPYEDLCKTCVRWMDICWKKDVIQRVNMESAGGRAYILSCDRYEKRNVKEAKDE